MLGDDPEGDLVRALHHDHGIAFTAVPPAGGHQARGQPRQPRRPRLSLYDSSRARDEDRFPEPCSRSWRRLRHAHVSITQPVCPRPARAARGRRHPLDRPAQLGRRDPYHEPFALAADIVFLSTAALTNPERTMRRIAARGRAEVVVATAGAKGAYLLADDELTHVPPVTPPAPVVDSNGAGDAFAAAFLYGWLNREAPQRCARYGAISGAHACTVPSTQTQPLRREELLARSAVSPL